MNKIISKVTVNGTTQELRERVKGEWYSIAMYNDKGSTAWTCYDMNEVRQAQAAHANGELVAYTVYPGS